jgi:hypothetical protein
MGAQTALTDHEGFYRFPNLPPGLYRVEATLQGFAPFVRNNARVEVGTTTTVDVVLAVAQVAEEVTVSAAAPVVDLERVERSFVVNQSAISVLPIAPRLAYQSLWQALPGVTGGASDYLGNENGDPQVNAGFGENEGGQQGTRNQNDSYENNIFIDCMDANDPMSGRSATSFNYEAGQGGQLRRLRAGPLASDVRPDDQRGPALGEVEASDARARQPAGFPRDLRQEHPKRDRGGRRGVRAARGRGLQPR